MISRTNAQEYQDTSKIAIIGDPEFYEYVRRSFTKLHRGQKGHAHPYAGFFRYTRRITPNQTPFETRSSRCWRPEDSSLGRRKAEISIR